MKAKHITIFLFELILTNFVVATLMFLSYYIFDFWMLSDTSYTETYIYSGISYVVVFGLAALLYNYVLPAISPKIFLDSKIKNKIFFTVNVITLTIAEVVISCFDDLGLIVFISWAPALFNLNSPIDNGIINVILTTIIAFVENIIKYFLFSYGLKRLKY
ncbi:MAG: hypothetical protein J1E36_04070 [Eubacterium sp.]|nr:hypothetical protein [Eubacterium sp.]